MKPGFFTRRTSLGIALASMLLAASAAHAATKNWNGSTSDSWTDSSNWDDGVPASSLTTDTALFNKTSYTNDPNYGTRSIGGLIFGDGVTETAAITLSGTSLLLGGNITVNANSGAVEINGANQIGWGTLSATNNSTSLLTIGAGIKSRGNTGSSAFTFSGSGETVVTGTISNGTGTNTVSLTKTGTGVLTLSGVNDYTGGTTIQRGTVIAGTDAPSGSAGAFGNSIGTINLGLGNGDVDASIFIGGAHTMGRDIRLLTVNGVDNGTRVLTLGGNTAETSEFSGNITLGTDTWAGRGVTLTAASGGQVTFSGVIQNPVNMDNTAYAVTKSGAGTVILSNNNTYTGDTNVSEGTLALGNNDVLPDASNVSLGAATLDAATFTDAVGTLNITDAATINLGSGAKFTFDDSSGVGSGVWTGTLTLTGTFVPGNGVDPGVGSNPGSLRFGTDNTGLTTDQLNDISATGWTGFGLDAYGYLTATSTGGNNYLSWASANGVTGGPNGDSDNDGVKNLVEYALADGAERGSLSGNTITFTKRGAPYGSDLTYTIETSTDLGISDTWEPAASGVTEDASAISYNFTPGSPQKNFARLKVVQIP